MSSGKKLQEMEVKTQQSRTAVNAGAKAADPMPKMADWWYTSWQWKIWVVLHQKTTK